MTEIATRLIEMFRSLPAGERQAVLAELSRSADIESGPLTDEELVSAGVELFAMYDAEEAASAEA
jgi:hypothetical protein